MSDSALAAIVRYRPKADMTNAFDVLIVLVTAAWFSWLIAWPYAVCVAAIGTAMAAVLGLRGRRVARALGWIITCVLLICAAALVHFQQEDIFYRALPTSLRPLGQVVILLFPLIVWIVGLSLTARLLWRNGGQVQG